MPFYQSLQVGSSEVFLWKVIESKEELLSAVSLSDVETLYLQSLTSVRRKQEWLSVRALLRQQISKSSQILYSPWGVPSLSDKRENISISHNKEFAVVALNPFCKIGVDVECKDRNFEKVVFRYTVSEELQPLHHLSRQELLCLIWCAKEAAFKTLEEEGVEFKEHLLFKFIEGNQFEIGYIKKGLYVMQGYFYCVENSIVAIVESKDR